MPASKRLPLLGPGRGGPKVGVLGRVLFYVIIDVLVVTTVVLAKEGVTLEAVAKAVVGDMITGALVGLVAYQFWSPQYDAVPNT